MNYYFAKEIETTYDLARNLVEEKLKEVGFGIVSEIDMHQKFKEKLNIDFKRYKILGACSPKHAYKAISHESHIGLMLPCNVVIQELDNKRVEVSVIDPVASMQAVENKDLEETANAIRTSLKVFVASL